MGVGTTVDTRPGQGPRGQRPEGRVCADPGPGGLVHAAAQAGRCFLTAVSCPPPPPDPPTLSSCQDGRPAAPSEPERPPTGSRTPSAAGEEGLEAEGGEAEAGPGNRSSVRFLFR